MEAQTLRGALEEIDSVDPQEGEDTVLKAESLKLMNVEALRTAAATASAALAGSEYAEGDETNVLGLLDTARGALQHQAEADEELASLAHRLNEVLILSTDISSDLASYTASLDGESPERLAHVQNRLAQLKNLTRKYGADITEVLDWAQASRADRKSVV